MNKKMNEIVISVVFLVADNLSDRRAADRDSVHRFPVEIARADRADHVAATDRRLPRERQHSRHGRLPPDDHAVLWNDQSRLQGLGAERVLQLHPRYVLPRIQIHNH